MSPVYVSCFKAFGDFVIALSAVKAILPQATSLRPTILAGNHLSELASALDAKSPVAFLGDEAWTDVPAAFDVGKRGRLAALLSLLEIRHQLKPLGTDCVLMFDRVGWRERFIGGQRLLIALPKDCGNIYSAYFRAFSDLKFPMTEANIEFDRKIHHAVIVPGSRIPNKSLPAHVVSIIYEELRRRRIEVKVVSLVGDAADLPAGVKSVALPRRFDALIATLKNSQMVVSADSLSAHLGEYLGLPTFVSTPSPNAYWLPQMAYRRDGWATFGDLAPFRRWLDRCLDT
jgi:ADP-heptose:LPS heptosyltransferase